MSSHDDDNVAGPSGLSHHESLQLLGLDISDSEDDTNSCMGPLICTENMADSDDDICEEALNQWEQSGGGLDPSAQVTFQFDLEPFVIGRVIAWGYKNVISRPSYVKGGP